MRDNGTPRLTLLGAGPGDPDLITLKGVKALGEADVILYDALVSPLLLDYAPGAKKIFVGKRKGGIYTSQDKINRLIVEQAFQFGHVVRLKGGDPFIFGRGSEEISYAESFGIRSTVIPGISSSSSVPAAVGIPLTARDTARSFWVVTGTTSAGELSEDIQWAALSSATVVILMGMSRISQITELFRLAGKSESPVAIIQNGTTPREKIGVGKIHDIEEVVRRENLGSPAVIVIGEVVRHSTRLRPWLTEEGAALINSTEGRGKP